MTTQRTVERINEFAGYHAGWHYGEGVSFSRQTIDLALALHSILLDVGICETDAFPSLEGEVIVAAYMGGYVAEMAVQPSGRVLIEAVDW